MLGLSRGSSSLALSFSHPRTLSALLFLSRSLSLVVRRSSVINNASALVLVLTLSRMLGMQHACIIPVGEAPPRYAARMRARYSWTALRALGVSNTSGEDESEPSQLANCSRRIGPGSFDRYRLYPVEAESCPLASVCAFRSLDVEIPLDFCYYFLYITVYVYLTWTINLSDLVYNSLFQLTAMKGLLGLQFVTYPTYPFNFSILIPLLFISFALFLSSTATIYFTLSLNSLRRDVHVLSFFFGF